MTDSITEEPWETPSGDREWKMLCLPVQGDEEADIHVIDVRKQSRK